MTFLLPATCATTRVDKRRDHVAWMRRARREVDVVPGWGSEPLHHIGSGPVIELPSIAGAVPGQDVNWIWWTDVMNMLRNLPDNYVDCCITSPPYWNLRDYGVAGQIGMERTPAEYIANLVCVFREVLRVLKSSGTCWINMGDCYANDTKWGGKTTGKHASGLQDTTYIGRNRTNTGLPSKSLVGMPWRLAFALQDIGFILRSEIIWHKPNCMPESVTDRPTRDHEQIFLLTKAEHYWFDNVAIKEPARDWGERDRSNFRSRTSDPKLKHHGLKGIPKQDQVGDRRYTGFNERWDSGPVSLTRNRRTVWTIPPEPGFYAHFAVFPRALVEPMVLAGCPQTVCAVCGAPHERQIEKTFIPQQDVSLERGMKNAPGLKPMDKSNGWVDTPRGTTAVKTLGWQPTCQCNADTKPGLVLDPFIGSGTVGLVARYHGRSYIGCDLNRDYVYNIARERLRLPNEPQPAKDVDYCDLPLFAAAGEK